VLIGNRPFGKNLKRREGEDEGGTWQGAGPARARPGDVRACAFRACCDA